MVMTSAEKLREYYWSNPERARKYAREKNKKWRKDNPEKQMMRGVKKRVKEKGYDFNIDLSDIVIPTSCPILGIPLILGGGDNAPTLDRVNNERGYVKGNVQVISYRANRMKSDGSLAELIKLGDWARSVPNT